MPWARAFEEINENKTRDSEKPAFLCSQELRSWPWVQRVKLRSSVSDPRGDLSGHRPCLMFRFCSSEAGGTVLMAPVKSVTQHWARLHGAVVRSSQALGLTCRIPLL